MECVEKAVRTLLKLPGIGRRTAYRLVEFLSTHQSLASRLAEVMADLARLEVCPLCGVLREGDECWNCKGEKGGVLFVVGGVADLLNLLFAGVDGRFFRFRRFAQPH
jgi:recombinational DNA repair protein RecR